MGTLQSCSNDDAATPQATTDRHAMTFEVTHPDAVTRATEYGFETGDRIGLFVNNSGTTLETGGNAVNNGLLTNEDGAWKTDGTLFLDNGTYDIHAYYPYSTVTSIEDKEVSVNTDQSSHEGFSASDIMFAKVLNYSDFQSPVRLNFSHAMSKLTIRLIKSEDYEGELPSQAKVYVHNTVTKATLDLNTGIATKMPKTGAQTIRAHQASTTTYEAIIVPQRLPTRVPLIEIEANGVSYLLESKFVFKRGMNHVVNVVIPSSPEQVKIEVGGEVSNWSSEQTR